jgi:hypothetical protein
MLRVEGLESLLDAGRNMPVADRLNSVVDRVYRGHAELHDDVTILAIEDSEHRRAR